MGVERPRGVCPCRRTGRGRACPRRPRPTLGTAAARPAPPPAGSAPVPARARSPTAGAHRRVAGRRRLPAVGHRRRRDGRLDPSAADAEAPPRPPPGRISSSRRSRAGGDAAFATGHPTSAASGGTAGNDTAGKDTGTAGKDTGTAGKDTVTPTGSSGRGGGRPAPDAPRARRHRRRGTTRVGTARPGRRGCSHPRRGRSGRRRCRCAAPATRFGTALEDSAPCAVSRCYRRRVPPAELVTKAAS